MTLRVGSLFAGIGGFDLAFERAGFEIVWAVEWDEACRRVLARRFPGVELHADVRNVGADTLSTVDVLVGGWPCQPVSVAGKRRASSDERDMWPEFSRVARELRPAWVVGENVPGVLSAERGTYFRGVVDDLTQLGYSVCWATLDAQHFGVPQRRRRVFVVGHLGDASRPAEILLESEGRVWNPATREQEGPDATGGARTSSPLARRLRASGNDSHAEDLDTYVAATLNSGGNAGGFRTEPGEHVVVTGSHGGSPAVAFAENQRGELREMETASALGRGGGKPGQGYPAMSDGMAVRRLTPMECERLQGFPDGWTEGQPDSTRYRQIGNAVAVPVVEWIARRLIGNIEKEGP